MNFETGTYKVKGTLIDKNTGKAVTVNGKELVVEKTVELKEKSGTVTIEFTVPAGAVTGSAVVFEEMIAVADGKEVLVGDHKDLNDADQTVEFYNPSAPPKTGDANNMTLYLIIGILAILALAGAGVVLLRRKRLE